jgi:Flp pilus assembly protein TadB
MTDGTTREPTESKRSLFALLGDIPTMVTDLVQREIELVKTEVTNKLKSLGKGSGLLAGAAIVVLFMVGVLLTSAVLALSLVMPGWAAALVVAGFLLIVAVVLGLIGYRILKKSMPYYPVDSLDSLQKDLRAIQGIGQRGGDR